MHSKILAVGPLAPPITGQSFAFSKFVSSSKHRIKVVNSNLQNKNSVIKIYLSFFRFIYFLFILCVSKFDYLYITTSRSNLGFIQDALYILFFKLLSNGKVVNHLHGSDFKDFRKNSKLKKMIDYVYNNIDLSIVLSPLMVEQYSTYKKMKFEVVNNFSDNYVDKPLSLIKVESFSHSSPRILYLSNLMYSKGILNLVDAVNKLNLDGKKVELSIVGDFISDSYMNKRELKERFLSKMSPHIRYYGVLTGAEKQKTLNDANIFCLPTFYPTEAQPISIIEALSASCLVLTTSHNYNNDFIPNDCAVFISNEDSSEHLYNAINEIILSPSNYLCLIKNGYELARSSFTSENYVNKLDCLLNS